MKDRMGNVLVAGGGIGGLSAALACALAGADVTLFEKSAQFSEFGAGIQLTPNAMRALYSLGLKDDLAEVVAWPGSLQVRNAVQGSLLGVLPFDPDFQRRYGAPYASIHRADLHQLLLKAVQATGRVELRLNSTVQALADTPDGVDVTVGHDTFSGMPVLVGADGGWSTVRKLLLNDGTPKPTGHLAYRAMILQSALPEHLRTMCVTAWLGPKLHVIQYPVRGGQWMNVVAIVHGQVQGDMSCWDHSANAADLQRCLSGTCATLRDLVSAIGQWRLWPLSIRQPMRGAFEQAKGHVALLGDAAHPMVPYLAQGAAMAIEDAVTLASVLKEGGLFNGSPTKPVPDLLQDYAKRRWSRNAKVQSRAIRNGKIFHASGLVRFGRDVSIHTLGKHLLDQAWLYGGP